jgi:hypothetical protein
VTAYTLSIRNHERTLMAFSDEQTLLFQLYNYLGSPLKCSSGCGHQFDRKHSAFFVLLVGFVNILLGKSG